MTLKQNTIKEMRIGIFTLKIRNRLSPEGELFKIRHSNNVVNAESMLAFYFPNLAIVFYKG